MNLNKLRLGRIAYQRSKFHEGGGHDQQTHAGGGGDGSSDLKALAHGRELVPFEEFGIKDPEDDGPQFLVAGDDGEPTTRDFSGAEKRSLSVDDIFSIGDVDNLKVSAVERYIESRGEPIDVVLHNGKYYVADGHHRLAAALLRKDSKILARVLRDNS